MRWRNLFGRSTLSVLRTPKAGTGTHASSSSGWPPPEKYRAPLQTSIAKLYRAKGLRSAGESEAASEAVAEVETALGATFVGLCDPARLLRFVGPAPIGRVRLAIARVF